MSSPLPIIAPAVPLPAAPVAPAVAAAAAPAAAPTPAPPQTRPAAIDQKHSGPNKLDEKKGVAAAGLDDDAGTGNKNITLVANDGGKFTLERKFTMISTLIKTSVEGDEKADEIKLPSVNTEVLGLIVTYMKDHKGVEPQLIEKPLRSKIMKDVCPHPADAEFIDTIGVHRQKLYDLILGANYMDIKSLLHLGCAKVASLIKGQPLEKIKDILDPKIDHTKDGQGAAPQSKDAKDSKESKMDEKQDVKTPAK